MADICICRGIYTAQHTHPNCFAIAPAPFFPPSTQINVESRAIVEATLNSCRELSRRNRERERETRFKSKHKSRVAVKKTSHKQNIIQVWAQKSPKKWKILGRIIFSYITLHYFGKAWILYKQISKITHVMSADCERAIIKLSRERCTSIRKRLPAFSLNSLRVITDSVRTHVRIVLEGYLGFGSHVGNNTSDPSSSPSSSSWLSPLFNLKKFYSRIWNAPSNIYFKFGLGVPPDTTTIPTNDSLFAVFTHFPQQIRRSSGNPIN